MKQYPFTLLLALTASAAALSGLSLLSAGSILAAGLAAWALTSALMPKVAEFMLKQKIFGLDINKKGSKGGEKQIPECVGFAAAVAFCMLGTVLVGVLKIWGENEAMTVHLAVLVSVMGTILLGFADDMLELPWRYKLLFPFFAVLPLLAVYEGITHVQVIAPFSWILGDQLELGKLYLLYIVLLGIYQTNTINIFAGINGLEVGQSIVAAAGLLVYFWLRGVVDKPSPNDAYAVWLLVVFLGTAVALMRLNAYPARIFIGDTFCYFAGIVLATAAVLGQAPIVCHWFIFPQLINFLYSTPQLFGFVPCPRHRLTTYHIGSDTLHAIPSNMNLLNLSLRLLGPTNEGALCVKLLLFQTVMCCVPYVHLLLNL